MPEYYAVATRGNKTFQGFVSFDFPVERMMERFHSYGLSVDFYINANSVNESQRLELGLQEEGNHEESVAS